MMERYDLVYNPHFHGGGIGKKENGKYVTYEDMQSQLKAKDERIKHLLITIEDKNKVIEELINGLPKISKNTPNNA